VEILANSEENMSESSRIPPSTPNNGISWHFVKAADFPVNGQGTFILTSGNNTAYQILVTSDKLKEEDMKHCRMPETYIALNIEDFSLDVEGKREPAQFVIKEKGKDLRVLIATKDEKAACQPANYVSYWFSYDRDAMVLKYGKGYPMTETTLLMYDFLAEAKNENEKADIRKTYEPFFNAMHKKQVIVYGLPPITGGGSLVNILPLFQFRPNPFVSNYPALVKDSSTVTLFDLDRGQYMLSSSLPSACQELYGNIKNLTLEYPENPIMKLSDAIRYSIVTPDKLLYKKLQEKKCEFGKDSKLEETYLRITLGPNQRTGPGIPYVLEIWPSGHYSPVHDHGNSCAVIKVLFGRITISVFNQQTEPPAPEPEFIRKFDAKEGDITWISPGWFQTHQLKSNTDDFCATIQCYRYANDDMIHWPGFDYPSQDRHDHHLEVFYPNSDFTFIYMRSQVLQEYQEYLSRPQEATY